MAGGAGCDCAKIAAAKVEAAATATALWNKLTADAITEADAAETLATKTTADADTLAGTVKKAGVASVVDGGSVNRQSLVAAIANSEKDVLARVAAEKDDMRAATDAKAAKAGPYDLVIYPAFQLVTGPHL